MRTFPKVRRRKLAKTDENRSKGKKKKRNGRGLILFMLVVCCFLFASNLCGPDTRGLVGGTNGKPSLVSNKDQFSMKLLAASNIYTEIQLHEGKFNTTNRTGKFHYRPPRIAKGWYSNNGKFIIIGDVCEMVRY